MDYLIYTIGSLVGSLLRIYITAFIVRILIKKILKKDNSKRIIIFSYVGAILIWFVISGLNNNLGDFLFADIICSMVGVNIDFYRFKKHPKGNLRSLFD